jgi:hypothetical protein
MGSGTLEAQFAPPPRKAPPKVMLKPGYGDLRDKTMLQPDHSQDSLAPFEARIGPKMGILHGDLRAGRTGSSEVDLKDELGLDLGIGFIFDLEVVTTPRWSGTFSYSYASYESDAKSTTRTLSYTEHGTTVTLPAGSTVSTRLDIHTADFFLRYLVLDKKLFENSHRVTFMPLAGVKVFFVDEKFITTNVTTGVTRRDEDSIYEFIPLVGFEARYFPMPNLSLGVSPKAIIIPDYAYGGGQVFLAFEPKSRYLSSFGVRAGVDLDLVHFEKNHRPPFYDAHIVQISPFVQATYGF